MIDLVRLLHFSDIHFVADAQPVVLRRQGVIGGLISSLFAQGLSGHDPNALEWLERSLRDWALSPWQGQAFLACTGDLSTWGDDASLQEICDRLKKLELDTGLQLLLAYGNHDVWPGIPGALPWSEAEAQLRARRTAMRSNHFPRSRWLEHRIKLPPECGKVVGICSLNTVMHCRIQNTLALGRVQKDFYWEPPLESPDHQLDELEKFLQGCDVAVVLSHHPVHDPLPRRRSWWPKSVVNSARTLRNATAVAGALSGTALQPSPNAIRLIVSGHTHRLYPAAGRFPTVGPLPKHGDLGGHLGQLITGSCTQAAVPGKKVHHSWESIDLRLDDQVQPLALLVERTVFRRGGVVGPFTALPMESLRLTF